MPVARTPVCSETWSWAQRVTSTNYNCGSTFSAWIEGLERLGLEAGLSRRTARERAEDVVLQIEGALILCGGLDDPTSFRRVLRKIAKEFLDPE